MTTDLIDVEEGWVCIECGEPVELPYPGAWWRHVSWAAAEECGVKLTDDAYNAIEDRYYQEDS